MNPEASERRIGLFGATALVVANMVGTGVFTTTGLLIADLGSAWLVMLTWLLGGAVAMLGALCYGALARHIPVSGGEYVLLSRTLHPAVGYLAGWISLLVGFAVPLGALGYAFGQYLSALDVFSGISPRASGTTVILAAALVHSFSLRASARAQAIAVAVELLAMVLFAGFGLGQMTSNGAYNLSVPGNPWGLGVALIMVSYSYHGWNAAVYVAGEVREPHKNLPRGFDPGHGDRDLVVPGVERGFRAGRSRAAHRQQGGRGTHRGPGPGGHVLGQGGLGAHRVCPGDLHLLAGHGRAAGSGAHGGRWIPAAGLGLPPRPPAAHGAGVSGGPGPLRPCGPRPFPVC